MNDFVYVVGKTTKTVDVISDSFEDINLRIICTDDNEIDSDNIIINKESYNKTIVQLRNNDDSLTTLFNIYSSNVKNLFSTEENEVFETTTGYKNIIDFDTISQNGQDTVLCSENSMVDLVFDENETFTINKINNDVVVTNTANSQETVTIKNLWNNAEQTIQNINVNISRGYIVNRTFHGSFPAPTAYFMSYGKLMSYSDFGMQRVYYLNSNNPVKTYTETNSINGKDWRTYFENYDADYGFLVEANINTYEGTVQNEYMVSTSNNETINLGKGDDTIKLSGNFGNDVIIVSEGENLDINTYKSIETNVRAENDDIAVSVNPFTVKLTAYVEGKINNQNIESGNYEFTLQKFAIQGESEDLNIQALLNNNSGDSTYIWNGVNSALWLNNQNILDILNDDSNITNDGGTNVNVTNLKIVKVINNTEKDITEEYTNNIDLNNAFLDDAYSRDLLGASEIQGTLLIKDVYGNKELYEGSNINLCGYLQEKMDNFDNEYIAFKITPEENNYIGSFRSEVAYSTKNDELFDMGTATQKLVPNPRAHIQLAYTSDEDTIVLDGFFGNDTVNLTEGGILRFDRTYTYDYADDDDGTLSKNAFKIVVVGNDLKLTSDIQYSLDETTQNGKITYKLNQDGVWEYKNKSNEVEKTLAFSDIMNVINNNENKYSVKFAINGTVADITTFYASDINECLDNLDENSASEEKFNAIKAFNMNLEKEQGASSITLKDFNFKNADSKVYLGRYSETEIRELPEYINAVSANTYNTQNVFAGGKITTKSKADIIDASGYISSSEKGLKINSGSGNDNITGSKYNDSVTVKSKVGEKTFITEIAGKNKITTNKGDDTIVVSNTSSNTIKLVSGNNKVLLSSTGLNKLTGGSGKDIYEITNGVNTITDKKGENTFTVSGGINRLAGGKNNDIFEISAGESENTINIGAGNDVVNINAGINNIKATKGKNKYNINGGTSVIVGGTGTDEFIFSAASDISAYAKGGTGNDIYDLTNAHYGADIRIVDTKGKNVLKLAAKDTILFNVTLGKNSMKDKTSSTYTFSNELGDISYKGSIKTVSIENDEYSLNIKGVAEQVASFMRNELGLKKGASAYDIFAEGGDNAAKLLAIYGGNGVNIGGTDKYVTDIYVERK